MRRPVGLVIVALVGACAIERERTEGEHVCDVCHGGDGQAAPPPDLDGNRGVAAIGVGAHLAHVNGTHRLSAPVACAECHQVPTSIGAPGHIDPAPAEVFPHPLVGLAGTDGAEPRWDRASATCADVYCHGATLADASARERTPVWTKRGGAVCGSCHGIPPVDDVHAPDLHLTDCAACHPAAVDRFGNPKVDEHIDGDVDMQ